uniref:Uncharacterized protein n=1 Tax=Ascaris lumbricoides TaxID=6252 RepID=A0A0M3HNF6_ASCLU
MFFDYESKEHNHVLLYKEGINIPFEAILKCALDGGKLQIRISRLTNGSFKTATSLNPIARSATTAWTCSAESSINISAFGYLRRHASFDCPIHHNSYKWKKMVLEDVMAFNGWQVRTRLSRVRTIAQE